MTLDQFEVFIPETRLPLSEMQKYTGLTKAMLSLYRVIYGLKTISIYEEGDLESLLAIPLKNLLAKCHTQSTIKYLIYVHTTAILLPFGDTMFLRLKNKLQLNSVITYDMTMQKCVSYFKALELLQILLENQPHAAAIILSGEVAFSPQLRVVPRSSIVGDAATASLFSVSGKNNYLVSLVNRFIPGYSKGYYLLDAEIQEFDKNFIQLMINIITDAISKAGIYLDQIRLILPHNINMPTWHKIADALHYPFEKIYVDNIPKFGHTFCSDHIINLHSVIADNKLQPGDYYLMAGCGMGFYLSAAVFRY